MPVKFLKVQSQEFRRVNFSCINLPALVVGNGLSSLPYTHMRRGATPKHDSEKHKTNKLGASLFVMPCYEVVGQAWPSTFRSHCGLPQQQYYHCSVAKAAHIMSRRNDPLGSSAQRQERIPVKAGVTLCSDRAKQ